MADLKRRGSGMYELRRRVPPDIRDVLGKKEIRVSLGTKDLRAARLARLAKEQEVEGRFAQARRALAAAGSPPLALTNEQLHALRARWLRAKITQEEATPPSADDVAGALDALEQTEERGRAVDLLLPEADALLASEGLLNVSAESRRELAELLFWAEVDFLNTMDRRLHGDYSTVPPSLEHAPAWRGAGGSPSSPEASPSLAALLTLWENAKPRPPKTLEAFRSRWRDFCAFVGPKDAAAVTREDAWRWKDALEHRGLDASTINGGYLGTASAVFGVADKRGVVRENPFRGVRAQADWAQKVRERRQPFDDAEAARVLAAARKRDGWVWWVTLLLAYTGARLEEVCGARAGDVQQVGAVWVLDINVEGEGRTLKNRASVRKVPLHPAVLSAGFPGYARALPAGGPLFPDLSPGRSGRRSDTATKHLARFLRGTVDIKDPRKVAAHSWRHRFVTLCREHGVPADASKAITGHAAVDVGDRYGQFPLPTLAAYVARIPPQV